MGFSNKAPYTLRMSETRKLPAGKIVGVQTSFYTIMNPEKYDPTAIPNSWQAFFGKYHTGDLPKMNIFYGAVIPNNDINSPMTYVAGILVTNSVEIPDGMTAIDFPEGEYFCVTHKGPVTELATSYPKAYMEEFPKAGREMRNAPHLEIYESDKDPMDSEYEMVIGIPVK